MTAIVMSCITNMEDAPDLGHEFEEHFRYVKTSVEAVARAVPHSGDLLTLYIQLQFDCRGMPNAVKGLRIGRYSAKHRDIQCVAEVPRNDFATQREKGPYLLGRVKEVVLRVEGSLRGSVINNTAAILSRLTDDSVSS